MSFKILCLFVLVAFAYGKPMQSVYYQFPTTTPVPVPGKVVDILQSGQQQNEDGSYQFHFRGADGTSRAETGVIKNPKTANEYLEVQGTYSYMDTEGKPVVVHYKADTHGFVPEGNNIAKEIVLAAKETSQLPTTGH